MSNSIPFVVGYEVEEIGLGFGTNKNPSFTTPVIKETCFHFCSSFPPICRKALSFSLKHLRLRGLRRQPF